MSTEQIFKALLFIHVAGGITALVVAPIALIVEKGGQAHRLWGKVYFYGMLAVTLSAFCMTYIHPNLFLVMVSVFSFHLIASGYRVLYLKNLHKRQKPALTDWLLHGISGLFSIALVIWGVWLYFSPERNAFAYIAVVFGVAGLGVAYRNLRAFFVRPADKMHWWYSHMNSMLGGYIATLSAFSAVNFAFLPLGLRWLWPTILIAPLASLWVRYYRKKFAAKAAAA